MKKYCVRTIRIVAAITLTVFVSVQAGWACPEFGKMGAGKMGTPRPAKKWGQSQLPQMSMYGAVPIFAGAVPIFAGGLREVREVERGHETVADTGDAAGTTDFNIEFHTAGSDEAKIRVLLTDTGIIEKTLLRLFGIECSKPDIEKVKVELYSSIGTFREVFLVTVRDVEKRFSDANFIMKITRATSDDYDTLAHETQNTIINKKMGYPFGFMGILIDGRMVFTGPLYPGSTFESAKHDYDAQVAVVREAVSIWKKTGGFFIIEPHRNQFVVDYSDEGANAHLVDKGHLRIRRHVDLEIVNIDGDGEIAVVSPDVDLDSLNEWIEPMTESRFIFGLIDGLAAPVPRLREADVADPDSEALGMSYLHLDRNAVVAGVIKALGEDDAADFFSAVAMDTSRQSEKRELYDVLSKDYPDIYASALNATGSEAGGAPDAALAETPPDGARELAGQL